MVDRPVPATAASHINSKPLKGPATVRVRPNTIRAVSLMVVLTAWEVYGRSISPVLFTYPSAIAREFAAALGSGELQRYIGSSAAVFFSGLAIAIPLGIFAGMLMGRFRWVEYAVDAYVNAIYATPLVAVVPLLVLWFGIGVTAKTVVVILFAVFPILLNTYQGVRSVNKDFLEVVRSLCARERHLWVDLILPSCVPFIVSGVRLAVGRALIGVVIAEFYTSITGLGYMIIRYANNFNTARMFVPILILMMVGVTLNELLKLVERKIAPWFKGVQL